MTEIKELQDIATLKKAVEAEVKHNYTDITGKKCKFSQFMLGELYKKIKDFPEDSRWKNLYAVFEIYAAADLSTRMKSIKQLIKVIKSSNPEEKETQEKKGKKEGYDTKNPEEVDIMYVKGVGPKVSVLLNKLGIFTAYDLLHYFPRKHLDYAAQTPIANLKVGEEATIFGKILSLTYFSSAKRPNLTIITITVTDDTGVMTINRFMGKTNRFMIEKLKAQFPKGANIIICAVPERGKYYNFRHSES